MADDNLSGRPLWDLLARLRAEGLGTEEPRDLLETVRSFRELHPKSTSASAFISFARARLLRLERLRACAARPSRRVTPRPALTDAIAPAFMMLSRTDRRRLRSWISGIPALRNDSQSCANAEFEQDHLLSVLGRLASHLEGGEEPEADVAAAVWRDRYRPEEYAVSADVSAEKVSKMLALLFASVSSLVTSMEGRHDC
jgi:hypothetical protein